MFARCPVCRRQRAVVKVSKVGATLRLHHTVPATGLLIDTALEPWCAGSHQRVSRDGLIKLRAWRK